jgi:hypothetical protein
MAKVQLKNHRLSRRYIRANQLDISEYYRKSKEICISPELVNTEAAEKILNALDYDRLDDHPSVWVPAVQKELLNCFKSNPSANFSMQVLDLYVAGAIMEDRAQKNISVKVGLVCLIIGVVLGLLFRL